ncbi:anti sigma factor C-terminal domain-containing protein [Sutcliffiella deserti]
MEHLETNGISHYGVVLTGPSKELLALKDEEWVGLIDVDVVELWNWVEY